MSLLGVTGASGFEYLNLALAERIIPLSDGCVDVQFSRTVVTLSGVDAQRALRWAQHQSEQTLDVLSERRRYAPTASSTAHPPTTLPPPETPTRPLDLPTFRAERPAETAARTEPSWRLR